jgi:hypothetical protein
MEYSFMQQLLNTIILDQSILQHLRYARNANPTHPICAIVSCFRVSQSLT